MNAYSKKFFIIFLLGLMASGCAGGSNLEPEHGNVISFAGIYYGYDSDYDPGSCEDGICTSSLQSAEEILVLDSKMNFIHCLASSQGGRIIGGVTGIDDTSPVGNFSSDEVCIFGSYEVQLKSETEFESEHRLNLTIKRVVATENGECTEDSGLISEIVNGNTTYEIDATFDYSENSIYIDSISPIQGIATPFIETIEGDSITNQMEEYKKNFSLLGTSFNLGNESIQDQGSCPDLAALNSACPGDFYFTNEQVINADSHFLKTIDEGDAHDFFFCGKKGSKIEVVLSAYGFEANLSLDYYESALSSYNRIGQDAGTSLTLSEFIPMDQGLPFDGPYVLSVSPHTIGYNSEEYELDFKAPIWVG